jgi:hypothetical protein
MAGLCAPLTRAAYPRLGSAGLVRVPTTAKGTTPGESVGRMPQLDLSRAFFTVPLGPFSPETAALIECAERVFVETREVAEYLGCTMAQVRQARRDRTGSAGYRTT